MTKPWDEVKEDIVRLIRDGASLEQVRSVLSRERKFSASTRSYRKKLAQWKLTRVGQFEISKDIATSASTATSSTLGGTVSSVSGSTRGDNQLFRKLQPDTTSQTESVADGRLVVDAPRNDPSLETNATSPPRNTAAVNGDGEEGDDSDDEVDASLGSHDDYERLARAKNGPEMFSILSSLEDQFKQERTSTLLHYAASQENFWVLDCILDFMLSKDFNVDATDMNGLTALETAIINERKPNVESLLRANADVHRRNPDAGTPLHRAASSTSEADICRVLLRHDARVNAWRHDEKDHADRATPLRIAIDRAMSLPMGEEKNRIASMIEALLEYDGNLSGGSDAYDHDKNILNFLDRWTRFGVPNQGDSRSRGFYLGHYFRADCDPLSWFPARFCTECHSMASYVFSHCKSELGTLLIKSTDMANYARQLAQRIIGPCKYRDADYAGPLSVLMRALLRELPEADSKPSWMGGLAYLILEQTPANEKAALLETILEAQVSITDDHIRTYNALTSQKLDDNLRFRLAEIILDPSAKLVPKESYENFMKLYLETWTSSSDANGFEQAKHSTFRDALLDGIGVKIALGPPLPLDTPDKMLQGVVHVLTKFLLTSASTAISPHERIEALRLRHLYALPEMGIASSVFFSIWKFDEAASLTSPLMMYGLSDQRTFSTYPASFSNAKTQQAQDPNLPNTEREGRPRNARSRSNSARSVASSGARSVEMRDFTAEPVNGDDQKEEDAGNVQDVS